MFEVSSSVSKYLRGEGKNKFVLVLKAGKSKIKDQQIQCMVRATYRFTGGHLFSEYAHGRKGLGVFLMVLLPKPPHTNTVMPRTGSPFLPKEFHPEPGISCLSSYYAKTLDKGNFL